MKDKTRKDNQLQISDRLARFRNNTARTWSAEPLASSTRARSQRSLGMADDAGVLLEVRSSAAAAARYLLSRSAQLPAKDLRDWHCAGRSASRQSWRTATGPLDSRLEKFRARRRSGFARPDSVGGGCWREVPQWLGEFRLLWGVSPVEVDFEILEDWLYFANGFCLKWAWDRGWLRLLFERRWFFFLNCEVDEN